MIIENATLNVPRTISKDEMLTAICDLLDAGPTDQVVFSAITAPHKDPRLMRIRFNIFVDGKNPLTPADIVEKLYTDKDKTKIRYAQAPLEIWLEYYKPLLHKMVSQVHFTYERLIPDRDDMLSILYLTVCRLYNQGYYLHQSLVFKSYVNALNMECRTLKGDMITDSYDKTLSYDEDGNDVTLLDQLADADSTDWARQQTYYTEVDYKEDLFNKVKTLMLCDMSEFAFNRILIQLSSHTVDAATSNKLRKYRELLNPGYNRRPNAYGQPKHKRQGENNNGRK